MIVFHVLHLLTCHFGPVGLFFSILLEHSCTVMSQSLLSAPDHHSTVFEPRWAYNAVDAFSCLVSTPSRNVSSDLGRSACSASGKP